MIGYTTVGTNDFESATKFYDAFFAELGAKRTMETDGYVVWGTSPEATAFSVVKPHDGKAATVGNGVMIALAVEKPDQVKALYEKAIELGGSCEGKPGPRGGGFYAAYFRDLDGNKLNAFCIVAE
ncbi:VOC family protein [Hirschia baltica]|uniref:Glyoxalase/bleomycin resistance protein/dioxygenase n=1 Tax=Hirschia baltica (strain ATCC 49814 / DSM 5838 / IFAM 1418) TaxID=582402 RepID=C6XN26_HIRBI|nr:VOC family protein [Hirschia baltica]ACT58196.1 Glyoxalase/bleomycin resistance protein/dioxygenase [Hirschia baltica ATCC 49814]